VPPLIQRDACVLLATHFLLCSLNIVTRQFQETHYEEDKEISRPFTNGRHVRACVFPPVDYAHRGRRAAIGFSERWIRGSSQYRPGCDQSGVFARTAGTDV
jgi:hypothetical protein